MPVKQLTEHGTLTDNLVLEPSWARGSQELVDKVVAVSYALKNDILGL